MDDKIKNFSEQNINIILYGDKDKGGEFEGVINSLERR